MRDTDDLTAKIAYRWAWLLRPLIPNIQEAEAGGSLELVEPD